MSLRFLRRSFAKLRIVAALSGAAVPVLAVPACDEAFVEDGQAVVEREAPLVAPSLVIGTAKQVALEQATMKVLAQASSDVRASFGTSVANALRKATPMGAYKGTVGLLVPIGPWATSATILPKIVAASNGLLTQADVTKLAPTLHIGVATDLRSFQDLHNDIVQAGIQNMISSSSVYESFMAQMEQLKDLQSSSMCSMGEFFIVLAACVSGDYTSGAVDADGDGVPNTQDYCPNDPNNSSLNDALCVSGSAGCDQTQYEADHGGSSSTSSNFRFPPWLEGNYFRAYATTPLDGISLFDRYVIPVNQTTANWVSGTVSLAGVNHVWRLRH